MRRWQINPQTPYTITLAAAVWQNPVVSAHDFAWDVALVRPDGIALAAQTRYHGRVDHVMLAPSWQHAGRTVQQAHVYAQPMTLTEFAPAYAKFEGDLLPKVKLVAEFVALSSAVFGCRYTLTNIGNSALVLRLDLGATLKLQQANQPLKLLGLENGQTALALGPWQDFAPVVLLEQGRAQGKSPALSAELNLQPNVAHMVRWVHVSNGDVQTSLRTAFEWLTVDWSAQISQIAQRAEAIPQFETGNADWDVAIGLAYQQTLQAFVPARDHLPHPSFVATRQTNARPTDRAWQGQTPQHSYQVGLAAAAVEPALAQGLMANFIATQTSDGTIDQRPNLDGAHMGVLAAPLLSRLAWQMYQYSHDKTFLETAFVSLRAFVGRWLANDADQDGAPEWSDERQLGYAYFPSFGTSQAWAQGANVAYVETPDLLAYLISEVHYLRQMSVVLGAKTAERQLIRQLNQLTKTLLQFWNGERFIMRDRNTHQVDVGEVLLQQGAGDQSHAIHADLGTGDTASSHPKRLLVEIRGGVSHIPAFTLMLLGRDANGQMIRESASAQQFAWTSGRGVYTSANTFAVLETAEAQGLSRVYKISLQTLDMTVFDINAVVSLIAPTLTKRQADAMIQQMGDLLLCDNGVTMCAQPESAYDPANEKGSGGVWPFWVTLLAEALLDHDKPKLAAEILKRLLNAQTVALKTQGTFFEFYSSDRPLGLGEIGHVAGVVPLHLLMRMFGAHATSPSSVWLAGTFALSKTTTMVQHGVRIQRSNKATKITFPSGQVVTLPFDTQAQWVYDPSATPSTTTKRKPAKKRATKAKPKRTTKPSAKSTPPAPPQPASPPLVPADQPAAPTIRIQVKYDDQ
jgi:hypothetical protein